MKYKDFNIYDFLKNRPLSYSAINSWEWSKEQWFETYILGKKQSSAEMTFGSKVDKKFQSDPKFLPFIPRFQHLQYKMKVVYNKIPLVGIPDNLELKKEKMLFDLKTGVKAWDKKRADETGQLTFYCLLLYIKHKIKPEEFTCGIHWLPTQKSENGNFETVIEFVPDIEKNYKVITTKRTMTDLLIFCERINRTVWEMQQYVRNHD